MIQYLSNLGGTVPVDFETAILDGFASDGGLYVPDRVPKVSKEHLLSWKGLTYQDLAFEILSLYIDTSIIDQSDLKKIIHDSFSAFDSKEVLPIKCLNTEDQLYVMELFHGPTQSFKDVAMGFLVNLVDYFLKRRKEKMTIIVATTGDTGPAAGFAAANKESLDAWLLYPKGMITQEQERQMTTLSADNVHPVGVSGCPDGGDDLDLVIAKLFTDKDFKQSLNLSSVNSINWGRVMMQTVHYFYGYLQIAREVGEHVTFSVPSGAFGNLFAGSLAREMGLPVGRFVCANNQNACLHRIFSSGLFLKADLISCVSSAIDIVVPYNFWRFLYFAVDQDSSKLSNWVRQFNETGRVQFDELTHKKIQRGFVSCSFDDSATLQTIETVFENYGYLLDPHGSVAVTAVNHIDKEVGERVLCLTTAHPAKFPEIIQKAIGIQKSLPKEACHNTIDLAKNLPEKVHRFNHENLFEKLKESMLLRANLKC